MRHRERLLPYISVLALVVMALSLLLGCRTISARAGQSNAIFTKVQDAMQPTSAVCAGRFTFHLPGLIGSGIDPQIFNDLELRWLPLQGESVDSVWAKHVDKLRTEQGEESAPGRIVKDYLLGGHHAVFYRYVPTPTSSYTLETWTALGDKVLTTQFDGVRDDFAWIEQLTLHVLQHFVLTSKGLSPGTGFCIQDGVIQLPPEQGEQVAAFVKPFTQLRG